MLLNGGIDRDYYGVDFVRQTYSRSDREIDFSGSLQVELRIRGNVGITLDGNISISPSDETFCLKNIAGLDYAKPKQISWNDSGVADPVYLLEVVKYFLIRKDQL